MKINILRLGLYWQHSTRSKNKNVNPSKVYKQCNVHIRKVRTQNNTIIEVDSFT